MTVDPTYRLYPAPGLSKTEHATIVDLLRQRAIEQPDKMAYTFYVDGEENPESYTYRQMDERARSIAAELQRLKTEGDRVLMLYPPGLEFIAAFYGCLYAGVVAIPAYPPGLNQRSAARINSISVDAGATTAFTTAKILESRKKVFDSIPELKSLRWIATDTMGEGRPEKWVRPDIAGKSLAYLQYTSGSTSTPKGVMVSHGNVLHNLAYQDEGWKCSSGTGIVSWLPHFHDFGLVFGILEPIFAGVPCVLMSPTAFVQRPVRWLQAIMKHRGSHNAAPNFAFDLCVSQVTPEERDKLDLSGWQVVVNGAEPVRAPTMNRFSQYFAPCGFRPEVFSAGYGLAEATLKVTSDRMGELPVLFSADADGLERHKVVAAQAGAASERVLVGNGKPYFETQVEIVNPDTLKRSAPDEIGEIWVKSPSLCLGYWNRPDASKETFEVRIADTGEGPFLRTGDLGFLRDGYLYITGRAKDLIIIRGVNHYPQDIELTVEQAHPGVRAGRGAAFAVDVKGEERLVIVYEVERSHRDPDMNEMSVAVRRAVAENHDLEVYAFVLVRTGSVPMTSSGKIQRHACKRSFESGELEVVAQSVLDRMIAADRKVVPPRDELESKLVDIWQEILSITPVGITDNFFDLGGNSLLALRLVGRIQQVLGKEVALVDLFTTHTIKELAELLRKEGRTSAFISLVALKPDGKKTPFFCVHPGGGTVMCFVDLTRYMDDGHPFYALQSQGVDGHLKPLKKIEEMAALYVREMRMIQPAGPYLIGGMCLGGIIAYEMAIQLEAMGEKVDLVAIFDTRRPPGFRRAPRPKRMIKQWLGSIANRGQERYLKKVWLANEKARNRYKAKPYGGKITLFWSDESEDEGKQDRVAMWAELAKGGADVVRVPGTHLSLLQEPHVKVLAEKLKGTMGDG